MRIKFIIIIMSLFFTAMFSAQIASAHPQKMHEVKKEQTQPQAHDDTGSAAHEHEGATSKATETQHDDTGSAANEHDAATGTDAAATEGGGHDDTGSAPHEHGDATGTEAAAAGAGGHDEADCGEEGAGGEEGGHSHWGISPDSSPFSKLMAAFGKYHPLIVHFPIALFITAAFGQFLSIRSREEKYANAVKLLVWLGALGALVAGVLGWMHSGPTQVNENVVMASHRWLGTAIALFGLVTAFVMKKSDGKEGGLPKNLAFNVLLFGMAFAVALNGFLGGALAHGGIKHLLPGFG